MRFAPSERGAIGFRVFSLNSVRRSGQAPTRYWITGHFYLLQDWVAWSAWSGTMCNARGKRKDGRSDKDIRECILQIGGHARLKICVEKVVVYR
jgi:hypothetical protein